MNNALTGLPASFRVIGVGNGVTEILDNVKSCGFDGFHEAGVLTLGLSEDAAPSYFDSILEGVTPSKYPDVIKSLLQLIVKPCYVSFDFHDLCTVLRDSGYFIFKRVIGKSITDVVKKMQEKLKGLDLDEIENMTLNILLNRDRKPPVEMKEMSAFSDMLATVPDTVNVIWAVHFDEELNENQIGLISIISGKELDNVQ